MVLVNLYELWCCRTLTQPITILKDFTIPPPSSRISICPLYVKLVKPKRFRLTSVWTFTVAVYWKVCSENQWDLSACSLGWAYYSCWLFDTYESICYAPWPEDPDTARNQRNLIPTDGENQDHLPRFNYFSIGGGIRGCVGEHCSEMDNASGRIPQSRWDPI